MINRPMAISVRQQWLPIGLMVVLICFGNSTFANENAGTSSRAAKQAAIDSIPYQQLNQQTRTKISEVVNHPSLYRRLPISNIEIDPDHLVFLIRHPEVIVNIWKIMGVTRMQIDRTGPFSLWSDDGAGTICDMELVYGTKNQHIFYCTGSYQGNIIKRKLNGQCVLILNTSYQMGPNGKPTATNQLDVFLKIENTTIGLVAKTLNPIVGPTADHNFSESLKFIQRLNDTTEKNGPGVQRMTGRLTDIQADIRQGYSDIAGLVYQRSLQAAAIKNAARYPNGMGGSQTPPAQYQPANGNPLPGASSSNFGRMNRIPTYSMQNGRALVGQASYQDLQNLQRQTQHQGSFRWANSAPMDKNQPPSFKSPQYPQQNYYWR